MMHARFPAIERRDAEVELVRRAFPLEIRAASDDGVLEGYGSVFGVRDRHSDVVLPGAFAKSLAAHKAAGTAPAMLWGHDPLRPCGVWTEVREDEHGLFMRGELVRETPDGAAALALLKKGALRGLSIGFRAVEWTYQQGGEIRCLSEIELWEVSLVTFPSNGRALVDTVKAALPGMDTPKDAERILRDAGFSRSDATAFVSRALKMGEARREAASATVEAMRAADRLASLFKA